MIRSLLPVLASLGAAAGAAGQDVPPAPAGLLSVQLESGRKFTGAVDARTTEQRLVLRFSREGAWLTRPIEWGRIVRASLDGQAVEAAELRETAQRLKSAPPEPAAREQGTEDSQKSQTEQPIAAQVTTATFDAHIANWDGDVETDGLAIEVAPLSADGYLVPISGTVEVELFAPQRRVFHHAPQSGGDTLEQVERWTRGIHAADFGPSGIRLRLPFGAVHPEFDLDWLATGLVHVRLVAPGHGVFDDSRDAVRIRPFAPLRDQLEMNTGRRFVPTERVGRHD